MNCDNNDIPRLNMIWFILDIQNDTQYLNEYILYRIE